MKFEAKTKEEWSPPQLPSCGWQTASQVEALTDKELLLSPIACRNDGRIFFRPELNLRW